MEIPFSFMVTTDLPHTFNIVFNESSLFDDIHQLYRDYLAEWYKVVDDLNIFWPPSIGSMPPEEVREVIMARIDSFRKSRLHIDLYGALNDRFYWDPGNYQLTVTVQTSKPDKVSESAYRFSITDADTTNLKLNVVTILEEPIASHLRVPNYPYSFAHADYK